jgi:hypothetical protein
MGNLKKISDFRKASAMFKKNFLTALMIPLATLSLVAGATSPIVSAAKAPTAASASATPPQSTAKDKVVKGGKVAPKGMPGLESTAQTGASPLSLTSCSPTCYFYNVGNQTVVADGAIANLSVSQPYVNSADAHSLEEVAVQSADGKQVVEVGWNVDPGVNGDSAPHLFVYHWVNGSPTCYNGCGWVDYAPTATNAGASLSAVVNTAKPFGIQYFSGNWWVSYDSTWIGYFPDTLWSGATPSVTFHQSGFIQAFFELAAGVTTPCSDMGNGILGLNANTGAARVGSFTLVNPVPSTTAASLTGPSTIPSTASPTYYTAQQASGSVRTFRGGGPGWNSTGTGAGTIGGC